MAASTAAPRRHQQQHGPRPLQRTHQRVGGDGDGQPLGDRPPALAFVGIEAHDGKAAVADVGREVPSHDAQSDDADIRLAFHPRRVPPLLSPDHSLARAAHARGRGAPVETGRMRYFEDFHVGDVYELGSRGVTREEILDFARQYDPQYFHIDEERAKESIYGGLIASGWHTAAMTMRLACEGIVLDSASMGSPGIDELRWVRPVRPGDTLTARMEILAARASESKPDRGIVNSHVIVTNQAGDTVLTWKAMGMYRRRPG